MGGPGKTSGTPSTGGLLATALSREELAEVSRLRAIDHRVRAHEQAHLAAAGPYAAAGPSYQYATGPDHLRYAVAGEVQIDSSPVPDDPQATVEKMLTVIAAANAPADPSPEDRQVAAQAARELAQAQAELVRRAYAGPDAALAERSLSLRA
jgi:hypothetical protein